MSRQYYHYEYFYNTPRGGWGRGGDVVMFDSELPGSKGNSEKSNTGESSYGTNNQVEGVDEADAVKSDGVHVYAAYGDTIVVWEASSGTEVSRTVIPTADDEGVPLCESAKSTDSCYENSRWQKMTIASLLMHQDRITAIAKSTYRIRDQDESTMYGSHATRLFVYDTSIPNNQGPLSLVAQKDVHGYYQSARMIDEHAHVVTSSGINVWYHLYEHLNPMNFVDKPERPLSRDMPFYYGFDLGNMTENGYKNAANAKAIEVIPSFVQQLVSESLGTTDFSSEDCTRIVRLMLYSKPKDTKNDDELYPVSFTTASALSNFAQVTSFNILATSNGDMDGGNSTLSTSSSGVFVPFNSYSNSVYSSRDMMIIAGEAYEENSDGNWQEKTVLFAFSLNSNESKAVSIGVVPGSLLNQFSMDHYSYGDADYLRVATTSWGRWGIVDERWGQTEESSSQVTVLSLPSSGSQIDTPTSMEIVGQVNNLGRDERIYAVRFLGTRAFVVTFRQIDPFYTLDMDDPTDPKVVGELKIPGFSNYLHPIGDGNLILAVGQDANENGVVSGLQVAMYNVTNFANPSQVKKFSENKGSNSAAQYDHQAFRYLPDTEVLILPVSRWPYDAGQRFDGFIVYDVAVDPEKKIKVRFEISHLEEGMNTCWSHSHLAARSMVFNGNVTTMKGHTVLSHALITEGRQWMLNLDMNRENECGSW